MKHAVISDHNDYYRIQSNEENIVEYAPTPTVQKLHQLMEWYNIDVLWAMPGCSFSRTIRREHFEILEGRHYSTYVPEHLVKNRVYGARVTYKIRGNYGEPAKDRFFMFPENREWKVPHAKDRGIWHVETPEDLLQIVHILETEYGYCLWGPSYIGLHYFKDILRRQDKVVTGLSPTQDRAYDTIARHMVHPISWANLHTRGKYIHWLDKNGWYLGGAQSVKLGNGAYKEVKVGEVPDIASSFWHYRVLSDFPEYSGELLPCSLPFEGWAHIDLLHATDKMGIRCEILEGIAWEQSSKYLNQWASDMWGKRQHFIMEGVAHPIEMNDIYVNVSSTAKMIPNTMMGRLRNEGLAHWNDAIIHRAIANQLHTLLRLYRDEGLAPVMISKDALFFVSDQWDVYRALPSMLEHEHEQRGYKHMGTCEMTDEIEHAFSRVHERRFGVNGIEATIRKAVSYAE